MKGVGLKAKKVLQWTRYNYLFDLDIKDQDHSDLILYVTLCHALIHTHTKYEGCGL